MSTTILSIIGFFGGRNSQSVSRPNAPQSNARALSEQVTKKQASWARFASHYATWATAGRLPLSE